jgi:N-methylhydantoinase B/oxoprolinase/acetone carboxylase alpha subunit
MPVFYQGELIAWTAALVHTTETGASEPGGMPIGATARFEEGLNEGVRDALVMWGLGAASGKGR